MKRTQVKRLLKMVVEICQHWMARGRYFLIENTAGASSWTYENLLGELIVRDGVFAGAGDQ